jgi:hypothetical protein
MVDDRAMQKTEDTFTDTFETEEILTKFSLLKTLKKGHRQAELRKGRFVVLEKTGITGDST